MLKAHSFHIPVMGIGFTIDTPLKVSRFGIDSVISLVDDILLEKLRKMYCDKFDIGYTEITDKMEDFRAKRITSYLNLIQELSQKKFEEFKNSTSETANTIKGYFNRLPNTSSFKQEFHRLTQNRFDLQEIRFWVMENMPMGSIDVNIMTKVDKDNYIGKEKLSTEFNDAHAALRGFANSSLASSVVLSAGMNPRLYSYIEQFDDFYPDTDAYLKKKIVLKVSDYRSALIQGKFLAKKGIWVSEYRIESGLNCGGHAFATDGYLMGPILEQFKSNKKALTTEVHQLMVGALEKKGRPVPKSPLPLTISAQGGVGTSDEHNFIRNYYEVESVGWGTPFLLVPEASTVDKRTLEQLTAAKEEDLYLSNISPLGIPFHSLRGNTKDMEKEKNLAKGRPGSACPKKFVALNKEYKAEGLCTASRQYQHLKILELEKESVSSEEYQRRYAKITEKSCTCVGLGTSALLAYGLDTKTEGEGVSICPGPNMAYFSKIASLSEMQDHIYGNENLISRKDRPHMFVKELSTYLNYLENQIEETRRTITKRQKQYLLKFATNLREGIGYYEELFTSSAKEFAFSTAKILYDFLCGKDTLKELVKAIEELEPAKV